MLSFKHKKVIVFDLDGTIVKLIIDWNHLKKILTERYSKIYREICKFNHITACLDHVVEKDDEVELKNFFKIIQDYEMKNIKNNQIIEETIFFIRNLGLFGVSTDIKLAIFSLNTRKVIIESLKLANVNDKFDFIIGREDIRKWKPNPEGLLIIKEHYKVKSEEIVYFGDLEKDIITGNNAGIEAHLINDLINLVNEKK